MGSKATAQKGGQGENENLERGTDLFKVTQQVRGNREPKQVSGSQPVSSLAVAADRGPPDGCAETPWLPDSGIGSIVIRDTIQQGLWLPTLLCALGPVPSLSELQLPFCFDQGLSD